MKSIYTEIVRYGRKMSVIGLIMSYSPYLRSATVRFPFNLSTSHLGNSAIKKNLGGNDFLGVYLFTITPNDHWSSGSSRVRLTLEKSKGSPTMRS